MFRCIRCGATLAVDAGLCDPCRHTGPPLGDDPTIGSIAGLAAPVPARDHWTLVPGTVLADRYRIVNLLGEGGMGRVYRADDLRLGQAVALKFISPSRANDGSWLQRLYSEVRTARSVSHPNVCRVHDIVEDAGRTFLSMEYVDGEDLASLLRRIGHPPIKKATALASQICSGLAAAHAKGIIHRDLKPANVMIDGRGQARITDFGLATATEDQTTHGEVVGTPGYMAPEQSKGAPASIQSDLYALGLVLYELHTGHRPERAQSSDGKQKPIPPPANLTPQISREANEIVMRCLEVEPGERPASAVEVSAAFPFDAIAEAIKRDQTPAPELVAAAKVPQLSVRAAWMWFAAVLSGLGMLLAIAPYMEEVSFESSWKSPEVLVERTQQIIRDLGYASPPSDVYWRMDRNRAMLRFRVVQSPPLGMQNLGSAVQGVAVLDYRQSETHSLSSQPSVGRVSFSDPLVDAAGDISVRIDSRGQLLRFQTAPRAQTGQIANSEPTNWSTALRAAGLGEASLQPVNGKSFVPYAYEERRDWEGAYPGHPDTPIHVLAAATGGRLTYFEVRAPWDPATASNKKAYDKLDIIARATPAIVALLVLMLGVVIVRNNIRSQRADGKGALRVAAFVFLVTLCSDVLLAHFPLEALAATQTVSSLAANALFNSAFVWVSYMAVEPFIRKRMPHVLNSWIRLIEGRLLDSAVGREILVGSFLGVLMELGTVSCWYLPAWFKVRGVPSSSPFWQYMIGIHGWLSGLLDSAGMAVFDALGTLIFFCLARMLVRHNGAALLLTAVFLFAAGMAGGPLLLAVVAGLIVSAICLLSLLRFGLLAYAACLFVYFTLIKFPHTLSMKLWYSTQSVLTLFVVVGFAAFGFWRSVGNQPLFGNLMKES